MSRRKSAMTDNPSQPSAPGTPNKSHTHPPQWNNPYDTSWVDNLAEVDFLIKEYLIFRGYHKTWEAFYRERKRDASKNKAMGGHGYQVELIVDQLIGYIRNLKLSEYLDFWHTLNVRIFNKLPPQYRESIYHLDTALKRYYLITARKRNNIAQIQQFLSRFGDELISRPDAHDWMKWFVLPHIKHPEKHLEFESYFHKNWSYSVQISLKNFLSTALCRFPRPKILAFLILKQERLQFKHQICRLTEKLNDADFIIRSLQQQLRVLSEHNCCGDESESREHFETNKLINKAISQYTSDNTLIQSRINITADTFPFPQKQKSQSQNSDKSDSKSLSINEKYFRSGTSPVGMSVKQPQMVSITENRHRKTIPEESERVESKKKESESEQNNDDVKAFNDSVLFNATPLTPRKTGLFKLPHWLRGKSQTPEAPKLPQTPEVLTPVRNDSANEMMAEKHLNLTPLPNLPKSLLQSQQTTTTIATANITMKTIFVPGVPINSVKFNDNGQRLAYSTRAGVIQVYQFPMTDSSAKNEKLSPSLLHTFCVSKPNEILQLCWDTNDYNRLFIAIGNPNPQNKDKRKNDDHIQIWNVGAKKCEYIISFHSNNCECNNIESINIALNRLIVSGYNNARSESILYLYEPSTETQNKKEWTLVSKSSVLQTIIGSIEFNHNGRVIIVGGSDGYIRIFDIKNGYFTQLTKWNAHLGCIESIHLCADTNSILSIAKDFCVKHWQLNSEHNSCKKVWKLKSDTHEQKTGESGIVPLLCVGPNNDFAVTKSRVDLTQTSASAEQKNEYIFNVVIKNIERDGIPDIVCGGHSKIITAIDWHNESQMLATCSVDGTLRIFQVFPH